MAGARIQRRKRYSCRYPSLVVAFVTSRCKMRGREEEDARIKNATGSSLMSASRNKKRHARINTHA
eukprot:6669771-Pyramimonas_sp.AAC.1